MYLRKITVVLAASIGFLVGSAAYGGPVIVQEDFDSCPVGPIAGCNNWTGSAEIFDDPNQGVPPAHSPPNYVYISWQKDAIWEIKPSEPIVGLTVEFYAEFQEGVNYSDPHIYLSPDGSVWTEVTDKFDITYTCNAQAMTFFDADLTAQFLPAGVQDTVFLRWSNEDAELPNCYVIGFDSVTATVTTAAQIPTVSEWGLVVMGLLLAAGGMICFGRRRVART